MKDKRILLAVLSTIFLLFILTSPLVISFSGRSHEAVDISYQNFEEIEPMDIEEENETWKVMILVEEYGMFRYSGENVTRYITDIDGEDISFSFRTKNISYEGEKDIQVNWTYESDDEIDHHNYTLDSYSIEDLNEEEGLQQSNHTFSEGSYNITLSMKFGDIIVEDYVRLEVEIDQRGTYLTAIGAGLAVGIAGMGAGVGVGIAGSAGAGTIAEKPDKFGKCLVFQALPQTQAIYGLLIAVLLLLFTGVLGGDEFVSLPVGIASLGIGLAVGVAGLSAIGQGIASSGSIAAYSEDEELFGKGMVFSVLPETQAIYGLLIGILIMVFTGLLGTEIAPDLLGDKALGVSLITIGSGLAVGVAGLSGIGQGIASGAGIGSVADREEFFGKGMVFSVLPETQAIYGLLVAILLLVFSGLLEGDVIEGLSGVSGIGLSLVGIGAGLSVGIAGLSGIGQGIASASGIGCVAEDEELFGKGMVFSVLPETQAIYGLLIAILLMVFSGLLGGEVIDGMQGISGLAVGLIAVGAGLSAGIAGLSGIGQGIASASGISSVAEKEELFGKGMVFSVLPETQAIYGLLIAILLMVFSGLLGGEVIDVIKGNTGIGLGLIGIGAGLAVGIAGLSGIGQGIASASGIGNVAEKEELFGKSMVFSVLPETQAIYGLLAAILLMIFSGLLAGEVTGGMEGRSAISLGLIGIGAGLAVGLAGLSGIGQGIASSGGIGCMAEDENLFGKGMVFSVLPETQAIYGLLIAILLMVFSGLLGGEAMEMMEGNTGIGLGLVGIGAGLAVGIAGLSGIGQGIASAGGIGSVAEKEGLFGKGMVFSVLPETQAIYGLLVAILLMVFSGLLVGEAVDGMVGNTALALGFVGIGAGLAVGMAGLSGIGQGIASAGGIGSVAENEDLFGKGMVFSVLPETQAIYGLLIAILLMVFSGLIGGEIIEEMVGPTGLTLGLIAIGAGLSVGVAGLSGIGQGIASSSGIGSVSEDEELFGKSMVFSVLPETQAIYGLLVAILLMIFSGFLGQPEFMDEPYHIQLFIGLVGIGAGLAVGVAGLSGIGQGIAAGSGISIVADDESMFGKSMVFSVLPETQAIYGLLIGILLMVFSGMLGGGYPEEAGIYMGIAAVGAGLAIGIAGVSGVGQGITSSSAISAVSRREDTFGKGMIFSVMSETFAIFGLLIAIFIIVFLGFM